MKKISNKNVKYLIIAFFAVIILCIVFFARAIQEKHHDNLDITGEVEVYVNGEALYVYEVDATLAVNPEVSREEIVENTINDMLMIQYARENGINVSDEDVEHLLELYQEHYPEIYGIALEGYGTEQLREGIRNRLLLSAALEEILTEPDYGIDISNEAINRYLLDNGIAPEDLDKSEYEEARNLYIKAQQAKIKMAWIENARSSAEIIYPGESVGK